MTDMELEQTISAAWDGEPVDLDSLSAALRTEAGREALASFVLIRAAATAADVEPPAGLEVRLRSALAAPRRSWLVAGPRVPMRIAASVAVLAVAGTIWVGYGLNRGTPAVPPAQMPIVATAPVVATPTQTGTPGVQPQPVAAREAGGSPVQRPPSRRAVAGRTDNPFDQTPPTPTRRVKLVVDNSGSGM